MESQNAPALRHARNGLFQLSQFINYEKEAQKGLVTFSRPIGTQPKVGCSSFELLVQMGKKDGKEVKRVKREVLVSQPVVDLIFIKHNFLKLSFSKKVLTESSTM